MKIYNLYKSSDIFVIKNKYIIVLVILYSILLVECFANQTRIIQANFFYKEKLFTNGLKFEFIKFCILAL